MACGVEQGVPQCVRGAEQALRGVWVTFADCSVDWDLGTSASLWKEPKSGKVTCRWLEPGGHPGW